MRPGPQIAGGVQRQHRPVAGLRDVRHAIAQRQVAVGLRIVADGELGVPAGQVDEAGGGIERESPIVLDLDHRGLVPQRIARSFYDFCIHAQYVPQLPVAIFDDVALEPTGLLQRPPFSGQPRLVEGQLLAHRPVGCVQQVCVDGGGDDARLEADRPVAGRVVLEGAVDATTLDPHRASARSGSWVASVAGRR